MNLYIGLMSGTSMDGIDAAVVDVSTHTLIAGITYPYPSEVKKQLQAFLQTPAITLEQFSALNTLIGKAFAQATLTLLKNAKISNQDIVAIGSHGQTVAHNAMANIPYTTQLGCPHTIAELTGIPVVADFRTRDMVIGGRGAPFAPVYHQALFNNLPKPLAIVNIGGVANVSFLFNDAQNMATGFDTGPGNCLMDAWIKLHQDLDYDREGKWAGLGRPNESLLNALLQDEYFHISSPKSIGKEYFSLSWLSQYGNNQDKPENIQATLLSLTAMTIANAILQSNLSFKEIMVCGGGAHNTGLLNELSSYLPAYLVRSTESVGINPDFIEAMMFAWLAEKTWTHTPVDLTKITGAKKASILGATYLA